MLSRKIPYARGTLLIAHASALRDAAIFVREFAATAKLGSDATARLAIVVEELIANLLDHAGLRDGQPIGVELTGSAASVMLVISDAGRSFDPRDAPPQIGVPPARGGGAGLALVGAWARIDGYERCDGRNRLTLTLDD